MTDSTSTPLPPRVKDITGKKFKRLTAVVFHSIRMFPCGKGLAIWLFKCQCGNEKLMIANGVVNGAIQSCGCAFRDYQVRRGPKKSQKEMYQKHRLKRIKWMADYRKNHPDRVKATLAKLSDYYRMKASEYRARKRLKTGKTSTIVAWVGRVKSKKVRCYYCGKVIPKGKLDIDHVVPLVQNGIHSIENLAASCVRCNRTKNRCSPGNWQKPGQQMLDL